MHRPVFEIKLQGFPVLKIQFLDERVINVISKDPLSESQLHYVVKYLYDEGFCGDEKGGWNSFVMSA